MYICCVYITYICAYVYKWNEWQQWYRDWREKLGLFCYYIVLTLPWSDIVLFERSGLALKVYFKPRTNNKKSKERSIMNMLGMGKKRNCMKCLIGNNKRPENSGRQKLEQRLEEQV